MKANVCVYQLIVKLEPRLILDAHTHNFCKTQYNGTPEWTIASFSWRNRNNPSFILVSRVSRNNVINRCILCCASCSSLPELKFEINSLAITFECEWWKIQNSIWMKHINISVSVVNRISSMYVIRNWCGMSPLCELVKNVEFWSLNLQTRHRVLT